MLLNYQFIFSEEPNVQMPDSGLGVCCCGRSTLFTRLCCSANNFNISIDITLGDSQIHTEEVESKELNHLQTEEKNKGRKSKIPIRIECTPQESADRREANLSHPENKAEQMDNINKRLKRIEKTLFPDIDLTD